MAKRSHYQPTRLYRRPRRVPLKSPPGAASKATAPDAVKGPPVSPDERRPVYLTEHECKALVAAVHNSLVLTEPLLRDGFGPAAVVRERFAAADLQSRVTEPWLPEPPPDDLAAWQREWFDPFGRVGMDVTAHRETAEQVEVRP